ncbi:hypothetical protein FOL47_005755 [Perkinsus chesapeaki]|uniref:Bystin n=1 Tax=Perkinsus chesapeaki TaxID=330153 RepID=A0A7J6LVR8_PERCH|nr:hypothetical protein FOL47_005755 [Perkinsus chesapeaki]
MSDTIYLTLAALPFLSIRRKQGVLVKMADAEAGISKVPREKKGRRKAADEPETAESVPSKITERILKAAQQQQLEEAEDGESKTPEVEEGEVEVDADGRVQIGAEVTDEDEAAQAHFRSGQEEPKRLTLADIIEQKLREREASTSGGVSKVQSTEDPSEAINPQVVRVYTDIGKWLSTYKSGKIPKAFKIIPSLINWEEVLFITNPVEWTPAATREATKIFVSNLSPKQAQRFLNLVLLPAVREDMAVNKRLNFHYYEALKAATFKPAAWFKGIFLPLILCPTCTIREAVIVCSVLSKCSLPVLHSAAALVRLCQLSGHSWPGPTASIAIRTIINKKYSLPKRAVSAVVEHYKGFIEDEREMPVLWHQSLLAFVQRYKLELSQSEIQTLKSVMKAHPHKEITIEIRRELAAAEDTRTNKVLTGLAAAGGGGGNDPFPSLRQFTAPAAMDLS